jgi:hypothetical protein
MGLEGLARAARQNGGSKSVLVAVVQAPPIPKLPGQSLPKMALKIL